MLSVPTLWLVFVVNFMALGLIWTYVARSYPNFAAAPLWTASAFIAALGAAVAMLRGHRDLYHRRGLGVGLVLGAAVVAESLAERPVSSVPPIEPRGGHICRPICGPICEPGHWTSRPRNGCLDCLEASEAAAFP